MFKIFVCTLVITAILNAHSNMALRIKLTKIRCNETDKSFSKFETCRVHAVARDLQYAKLYINFLQLPINDLNVRFKFLKRANGYKPFLYDFVVGCDFMKHLNPLVKLVWGWFKDVSNLNHTCPLTEYLEIKRLENRYLEQQLGALPIINGDYAFFVYFSTYNVSRFYVEFYATIY